MLRSLVGSEMCIRDRKGATLTRKSDPARRMEYKSQALAEDAKRMEAELLYIQKAKAKEKEVAAERKKYSGSAHWSRGTTNTSIRTYEKQFMAAVSSRPGSGSGSSRPGSRERSVLDCAPTNKPSPNLPSTACLTSFCQRQPRPAGRQDAPARLRQVPPSCAAPLTRSQCH
eukprot:TRINITY_DN21109_c0_g1_i1.p1 TRINITY_DN21109_c0_g1~~TRINITY_DN21109_c0_g1_i1.p1  ORF type:complete len:171 (+),score=44.04 TRINITY_DN21109_c0_g1_i1:161-673(+)